MLDAARIVRVLFSDGVLLGEECRFSKGRLLVEWYRFGATNGF